ncbi:MAG: DUF3047 domain-containing protein [Caulobacter sp.]|nr:DUF3047 domain-containing protein [Caulobacter sp.]
MLHIFATILLLMLSTSAQADGRDNLMQLDATNPMPPVPWRVVRFDEDIPATQYRVREWDGVNAIEATADRSMALLARPVTVDLAATPMLCWRWRVDAPLSSADMTTKAGDDYAARVYLAFKLASSDLSIGTRIKLKLGRTIYGADTPDAALNYVWDNRYPVGTMRWNAYTDRARMIVVQSGAANAGKWVAEQRDIQADFVEAFKIRQPQLTSLAIASDTDNTGESAHAGFADFHFVPRGQACSFP